MMLKYQFKIYQKQKTMVDYFLTTQATQIDEITSMRIMVATALLFTFTIHYIFIGIAAVIKKKVKMQRIYDHGRRLVLYGIAALLSITFLNYGVYHSIVAWLGLICVLIMHSMGLIVEIRENHQNLAVMFYYILMAIWFFGILFFFMFNALN